MSLTGQTEVNIILRPVDNRNVIWNLGKGVVVENLGNPILIGEPAKKDNEIVTIAHQKKILAKDTNGKKNCLAIFQ